MPIPDDLVASASAAAKAAADRSGVEIRLLAELDDLARVYDLFDSIWRPDKANPPVTIEQLRAMTHAGNYAAGAFAGTTLVGACVGFFAAPVGVAMHSHVAGVAAEVRHRSVGFALKLHQRAWALQHGLREITWTCDPLVRRNAYFNLVKLGARPRHYLIDFYGDIVDAINAGQGSDRLLMAWDLAAPHVRDACAGRPAEPVPERVRDAPHALAEVSDRPHARTDLDRSSAEVLLVQIPPDIERLRQANPAAAKDWRHAVRDVLGGLMADGARVTGFTRSGSYVVERTVR